MAVTTSLLERYDREERRRETVAAPGYQLEWDGPVFRMTGPGERPWENGVLMVDGATLTLDAMAEVVDRQIAYFAGLGRAFEWKLFEHDTPAGMSGLLAGRGLRAEPPETVVAFPTAEEFPALDAPTDVRIEAIREASGLAAIARLNEQVYGNREHAEWLAQSLAEEMAAAPEALSVVVARAGDEVVAAGWLRLPEGTSFASLWGGCSLPRWRQRGIYTALVAQRIERARDRGYAYVTVDCGAESLPILLRRGFVVVATTTPWIYGATDYTH